MKLLSVLLMVTVLSLALVGPASAIDGHCSHDMTTVESLHHCVMHAAEMGHISQAGVANALLAKVDAAQAALDRGQPAVAAVQIQAFVHQVQAQSGKSIDPMHATHMVHHAEMVIAALGQ